MVSVLLSLTLLILTLPGYAGWHCPDGMACPANCPMMRGAVHTEAPGVPHCSRCIASSSPSASNSQKATMAGCRANQCYLRLNLHTTPCATLVASHYHPLVLAPAISPIAPALVLTVTTTLPASGPPTHSPPSCVSQTVSDRAPPRTNS